MKRLTIILLVGAALIAGCTSSTNTQTPTSKPVATTQSQIPTASDVLDAMGTSTVANACLNYQEGIDAGASQAQLFQAFAQGYDQQAPANAPSARAVFNEFISRC